jgi:hypothetical protein
MSAPAARPHLPPLGPTLPPLRELCPRNAPGWFTEWSFANQNAKRKTAKRVYDRNPLFWVQAMYPSVEFARQKHMSNCRYAPFAKIPEASPLGKFAAFCCNLKKYSFFTFFYDFSLSK